MLLLCTLQMKALSEEQQRTQVKLLFILTAHHSHRVIGRSYATPRQLAYLSPKPNNQIYRRYTDRARYQNRPTDVSDQHSYLASYTREFDIAEFSLQFQEHDCQNLLVEGLDRLLLSWAIGNSIRMMNDEVSASRRYCTVPLIVFTSFWHMYRPRPSLDTPGLCRNISCIRASGTPGAGWTILHIESISYTAPITTVTYIHHTAVYIEWQGQHQFYTGTISTVSNCKV